MTLFEKADYLNSDKARNRFNTDEDDYNCGGYSLNTFNWYYPYFEKELSREEEIVEYHDKGFSVEDMYQIFLQEDLTQMKKDFPSLKVCKKNQPLKKGQRIVAYRIYIIDDGEDSCHNLEEEDWVDCDFHYRFRNYGENFWREKQGWHETVKIPKDEEDYWGDYDSEIIYFTIEI